MKYASLCELLVAADKIISEQEKAPLEIDNLPEVEFSLDEPPSQTPPNFVMRFVESAPEKTYPADAGIFNRPKEIFGEPYVFGSSKEQEQVFKQMPPETASTAGIDKPAETPFPVVSQPLPYSASAGLSQEDIKKMLNTVDGMLNDARDVRAGLRKIKEITGDAISDIDKLKKKYSPG